MSHLFTPMPLRTGTVRNRVVMPPMVTAGVSALHSRADEEGCVSDGMLAHYARRAQGGTGLLIVEASAVDPGGRCWHDGVGIYDDRHLPGLARLADAIHAGGALAAIQLVHGGPQGSVELDGGETVGPSAVPPSDNAPTPRALTVDEIQAIEARFATAAARAVAAGFDGVEIHGAHGFLLDSFLSAQRNRRTDAYGGSLENRLRMLLETCRLVRARLGAHPLLWSRFSLFNKAPGEFSPADVHALVQALAATGLDLLHLSTTGVFDEFADSGRSLGQLVKSCTDLPLIVAGELGDPRDAERAIAEGHADLAAIGRKLLDDPAWAAHAAEVLR